PWQVEVIAPVPQHPGATPTTAVMTMTSCHPKYSATQRYVTFSHLVKVLPRSEGLPASFMAVPAGAATCRVRGTVASAAGSVSGQGTAVPRAFARRGGGLLRVALPRRRALPAVQRQ